MSSSGDDTPPRLSEKQSKRNKNWSAARGCTKAACPHDVGGASGSGSCAHGARAKAQAQAPPSEPWNPVGAARWEFVPGIGMIPATDPVEDALDAEG